MFPRIFIFVGVLAICVPVTGIEPRIKTPLVEIALPGVAHDMALAPDGKTVATATSKGAIAIWDVETGKRVREFEDMGEWGRVALSHDGKLLAGGGKNGLAVWEVETGRVKQRFPVNPAPQPDHLFFSPTDKLLSIVTTDPHSQIVLWDLATKKFVAFPINATPTGPQYYGRAATFSLDGKVLYYLERGVSSSQIGPAGGQQTVTVKQEALKAREVASGKVRILSPQVEYKPFGTSFGLPRMLLAPDGKTLYYGTFAFDLTRGVKKEIFEFDGAGLSITPDGKTLAANNDPGVSLYDLPTGSKIALLVPELTSNVGGYVGPAFTPDLRKLVTPGGGECLWVWDVSSVMKGRGAR